MRAAVYRGPRQLVIEETADPATPGPDDILIAVTYAAICGTDATEWLHGPVLARPPVILGHEFTGTVTSIGHRVRQFSAGDRVVCGAGVSCGDCGMCRAGRTNLCTNYYTIGLHVDGGLADQVLSPASICLAVPSGVSSSAAALAQPLAVALHAVRRSGAMDGRSCVVLGAGGIGAFIVAASAAAGASPLIVVDIDHNRLSTARALGADATFDATDNIAGYVADITCGLGVDVVIEASGVADNPALALSLVRKGGDVVIVGLQSQQIPLDLLSVATRELNVRGTLAHVYRVDLVEALELLGSTSVAEEVIDRVIPLESLVDEGIRALAEGRSNGKIVVRVNGE